MASTKIIVIEKTPGTHIQYATTTKKIIFGDDELSINLAAKERDFEVSMDICMDCDGGIVIGTGGRAQKYAAQVIIPPRRYDAVEDGVDENGVPNKVPVPIELDMSLCTLIIWGLEV